VSESDSSSDVCECGGKEIKQKSCSAGRREMGMGIEREFGKGREEEKRNVR
jgi:hypothetical protein